MLTNSDYPRKCLPTSPAEERPSLSQFRWVSTCLNVDALCQYGYATPGPKRCNGAATNRCRKSSETACSARTSPLWREYRRVSSRWNEVVGGCCCFVSLFFFFGCFPALPLGANVKRLSVSNLFLWRAISERSVGTKWTAQCGVSVYGFYVVHFVGPNFYRYRATGLCGSDKSEEMIMTDQGFFGGEKVREIGTAKKGSWEAGKQFRSPIIEAVLIDHLVAAIVAFRSRGRVRACVCVCEWAEAYARKGFIRSVPGCSVTTARLIDLWYWNAIWLVVPLAVPGSGTFACFRSCEREQGEAEKGSNSHENVPSPRETPNRESGHCGLDDELPFTFMCFIAILSARVFTLGCDSIFRFISFNDRKLSVWHPANGTTKNPEQNIVKDRKSQWGLKGLQEQMDGTRLQI